ncbi:MAG: hypothetical protein K8F93_18630 [Burkholderiales bacterium]|nr:hypothetical protein [Burkholderiales bacterium]MCL4690221.1 hypothetical protein [Burkholderiales bacterium]
MPAWIVIFSQLGRVGAIAGSALFLLFPSATRRMLVPCLVSYATGTLLAAAFLGMIPAGRSSSSATPSTTSSTAW